MKIFRNDDGVSLNQAYNRHYELTVLYFDYDAPNFLSSPHEMIINNNEHR